jgi:hypothetical protein
MVAGEGDDMRYVHEFGMEEVGGGSEVIFLSIWIYSQNGFKDGVVFASVLFVKLFSYFGCFVNIVLLQSV